MSSFCSIVDALLKARSRDFELNVNGGLSVLERVSPRRAGEGKAEESLMYVHERSIAR